MRTTEPTMTKFTFRAILLTCCLLVPMTFAAAQEVPPAPAPDVQQTDPKPAPSLQETTAQTFNDVKKQVDAVAADVDKSKQAQDLTIEVLKPIYKTAELLAFPAFHWVAFTLMAAGVVGFALQLVFAKLLVLAKMSLSLTEIFSDAMGLAISVVGLVLTTQAAAENSDFTQRPFMVLSAASVGIVLGLLHYVWGQRQEIDAATGRRVVATRGVPRAGK